MDDSVVSQISGEENWVEVTFELEAGGHQLKWMYAKDDSVFWGADRAWLDQLVIKRAQGPLPEGIYFLENFDGLPLGPFESSSESKGDGTDWTGRGPEGWVMARGPGHGLVDVKQDDLGAIGLGDVDRHRDGFRVSVRGIDGKRDEDFTNHGNFFFAAG